MNTKERLDQINKSAAQLPEATQMYVLGMMQGLNAQQDMQAAQAAANPQASAD